MSKRKSKPIELPDITGGKIHICVHNAGLSEFVEIQNHSQIEQPLTGWSLATLTGNQIYKFSPVVLPPSAVIRVHSGLDAINAPPRDWVWTTENVWSNRADVAVLFDITGAEIARHAYPNARQAGPACHKEKVLVNTNNQPAIVNRPPQKNRVRGIRRLQF